MAIYLLKFSACLLVFWLLYIAFLERQNRHHFKRFYLLGVLALALIIPKLTIIEYVEPVVTTFETTATYINVEPILVQIQNEEPQLFDLETTLWCIYGFGALVFTIRFLVNLFQMRNRISKNERLKNRSFIYVLLKENRIPHSFFRYIFFNKTKYESNHIPKEVMLHEETHAKQLHSLDIIILELLQIAFWFHPLIYILKHHVKLNHEFLADQAVLKQGVNTKTYQNILLQFSSSTQNHQLASAINYSSIKKRFTVMKTQTSKTRIWLSTLLILPIIAVLFYSFAEKEYVEKEPLETSKVLKIQNGSITEGATEKLMQEYRDFIMSYNDTNVIIGKKYERAIIIYDQLMSDKQRLSVEKYPARLIPEPNLSKTTPRKPTSEQLEAFKDTKKYAIWIDGKHVPNSILNNYAANDFVHYSGSIVHKNARSKSFPQPNQYHLYTTSGFKATYQDSQLNRYNKATETYANAISVYLKGPQTDNSELKILKAQADKIYNSFTKEELEKHNILMAPPVPAQYPNSNGIEKPIMVILIDSKGQLLVNDELTTLNRIESRLNNLSESFDKSRSVYVKYDDTKDSYKVLKEVKTLIRLYNFKVIQGNISQIAPPPPPAKQKTSKGGPNTNESYNYPIPPPIPENATPEERQKMQNAIDEFEKKNKRKVHTIKPIEILIKKDNSVILNNKPIKFKDIANTASKINKNLTINERRNFVFASILMERNDSYDFALKIQKELRNADIWASSVVYLENQKKSGLPSKHFNHNAGLTVDEAKQQKMKLLQKGNPDDLLNKQIDSLNKAAYKKDPSEVNPWAITTEVTYIPDSQEKKSTNPSFLEFMEDMESQGATFYLEDKEITAEKAKTIAKTNKGKSTEMTTKLDENGKYMVLLSTPKVNKPQESILPLVNGKIIETGKLKMSLNDLKKLKLTLPSAEVTAFKFKIPGVKTEQIKGNTISEKAILKLQSAKVGDYITVFNIKDGKDSNITPLAIEIVK
ncbi:M56 family metallopeptidase [Winogradskyella vidalii]|uniref:M56 family metallopeptidase n=1 Tax=Winogradskyella vidalii TaxID=2615024 RepID=UPI0015C79D92|nr:M56 family metallopeptidase [Winogradskyella vidalii]